jgi:hypothetical protein
MRKQLVALGVAGALTLGASAPALAGPAQDAALALGAFAVFNQIVRGETIFHAPRPPAVVYAPPPVVYAPPPAVVYAPPPVVYAPPPPVVVYPAPPVVHYPGHVWVKKGGRWGWVPKPAYWKRGHW